MDEGGARNLRAHIAQILREEGFNWVVDEVQAVIDAGQLTEKSVKEPSVDYGEVFSSDVGRSRARRASRTSTQPYSEQEQLALLLDAIENAISSRNKVELATLDALKDASRIEFIPSDRDITSEDESAEPLRQKRHSLDREGRETQDFISTRADAVLTALRSRLNGR